MHGDWACDIYDFFCSSRELNLLSWFLMEIAHVCWKAVLCCYYGSLGECPFFNLKNDGTTILKQLF
jgi:hypothetical protein